MQWSGILYRTEQKSHTYEDRQANDPAPALAPLRNERDKLREIKKFNTSQLHHERTTMEVKERNETMMIMLSVNQLINESIPVFLPLSLPPTILKQQISQQETQQTQPRDDRHRDTRRAGTPPTDLRSHGFFRPLGDPLPHIPHHGLCLALRQHLVFNLFRQSHDGGLSLFKLGFQFLRGRGDGFGEGSLEGRQF